MTDDARLVLTEEERARFHAARNRGGLCAGCGRALSAGEPVWWAPFAVRGTHGRRSRRWAPVGEECAPSEFVRETAAGGPESCLA
jgi:hypothetical protein